MSLPTRECGLKRDFVPAKCLDQLSLPTRECGLKHDGTQRLGLHL